MKVTNNNNLPQAVVDAVKATEYDKGEAKYSITELLSPPRIAALRHKHDGDLTEDASDRIWSLVGRIGHGLLEKANRNDLVEKRFYMNIEGEIVGGKFDSYTYTSQILTDFKFVTAWKFKDGLPLEYEQQLNLYGLLLSENNLPVQEMQIVAILRDWSKQEARRNKEYPQSQAIVRRVPAWPKEKTLAFLKERVALHKQAREAVERGEEPSLCTNEERWLKPTVFAVTKKGASRALRLLPSYQEAVDWVAKNPPGGQVEIVERKGENTRCISYCPVSSFCKWWQNHPDRIM